MLHEGKERPFRNVGALQRWHYGLSAIIGREQEDILRRETEELRQQMLALAATVTELRARQAGRPAVLPDSLIQPAPATPPPPGDLMHRLARRLEKISAWLCWLEPWWIEGFLTLNSAYAAWVLLATPDVFVRTPGSYLIVAALLHNPLSWGIIAALASATNAAGLALTFPRSRIAGLLLRLFGVTLSGLLWFAMGLGAMLGDPGNIFAMAPFLASLWAFWVLIRFPAVP